MRKVPSLRLRIGFVLDDALALLTIFETIALGQLVLHPFSLYTGGSFAWYQAQMFRGLAALSPILLVLLLYAWLARLILKVGRKHSTGLDKFSRTLSEKVRGLDKPNSYQAKFILLHHPRLLLILAMTAAVLLGLFPYWPGLNPNGNIVGTDTPLYIEWTRQMLARPFPQALSYAFSGADSGFRPVPLILTTPSLFALIRPLDERKLLTTSTIVLVAVGIIVDVAKNQVAGGASLAGDLGTKGPVFGISQLVMFWPNVSVALNVFYDGLIGNVLLLALSALSFVTIRFNDKMEGMLPC